MSTLRIVIADDQVLMREGLQTILNLESDMEVTGLAANGQEALELIREQAPDILLLDIQMPVMNGIECTRRIREEGHDTVILLLTTFLDDIYVREGLGIGANGYLLKDMDGQQLLTSIRDGAKGNLVLPSSVANNLATQLRRLMPQTTIQLQTASSDMVSSQRTWDFTAREKEISRYMREGLSNKEIARALYMNEGTIRNYVSLIYGKLGVRDRTAAVILLRESSI